jgi:phage-related baseplate assembly protein
LGDRVTVQSAQVLPYRVDAVLHMKGPGPESAVARDEAERRLAAWINPRRRLGVEVARSAVDAQLHVPGVSRVELIGWKDLAPTTAQAAFCTGYSVKLGE